jgi:HK97 gp10 family phage protein
VLLKAAQAGADVAKAAIIRNAPIGISPGKSKPSKEHIRDNIIVYKRRRTQEEQGNSVSLLVGPNKHGFYGYFIEHGIAGKAKISPRQFVDRAFNECAGQMRQAVIESLQKAVKAG